MTRDNPFFLWLEISFQRVFNWLGNNLPWDLRIKREKTFRNDETRLIAVTMTHGQSYLGSFCYKKIRRTTRERLLHLVARLPTTSHSRVSRGCFTRCTCPVPVRRAYEKNYVNVISTGKLHGYKWESAMFNFVKCIPCSRYKISWHMSFRPSSFLNFSFLFYL